MSAKTVLTSGERDKFVGDLVGYGTDFVAPLYAVVGAIEQAVLNSPEVVAMRWHPIETAPKDGKEILVYCSIAGTHCVVWDTGLWRETVCFLGLRNEPTHWMPLPAPPSDATMENKS